jgi:beta-galactosidase
MSASDLRVTVVPGRGLRVGDTIVPLVSGAVHYWRHEPDSWPVLLDAVKDLGLDIVETYVPWSVHETDRGEVSFDGRLDVAAFLKLAADRGLLAVVRPGPHINAELDDFGFPRRVLDVLEHQALGPLGTPVIQHSRAGYFRCPSYSSSAFLAEVEQWYDEVLGVLTPLQWPRGPIVAMQVDNEMGYFFFVDPFVMDYHPEAVEDWRRWSGQAGDPPVDGSADPELALSWVRHKEHSRLQALTRLADAMRTRGVHVPVFHNDFNALTTPLDQAVLESSVPVDIAATDLYLTRESLDEALTAGRTLAAASQLPYVAELGAGWVADIVGIPQRLAPADADATMLALLLTGVKAWNWYMLVEREHWYGSPIDRYGRERPDLARHYRQILDLVTELDWWSFDRQADVLLLHDRESTRRHASGRIACEVNAVLDPLQFPPGLREIDPDPQQLFLTAWREAIEAAGLDVDEGSSDAPPADLSRYRLIVGPPGLDIGALVESRLPDAVQLPAPTYGWTAPAGVSLHRLIADRRILLGVLNRRPDPARIRVTGVAGRARPCWPRPAAGEGLSVAPAGVMDVDVPAYSAMVWEVVL